MGQWVRLCSIEEAPKPGGVAEADADGTAICLANIAGSLHALENACPHRGGPLGQGWVEGQAVVCPWHAWAFDAVTGLAEPEQAQARVFPIRHQDGMIFADLS